MPSSGDLPNLGIKPAASALQADSYLWATGGALLKFKKPHKYEPPHVKATVSAHQPPKAPLSCHHCHRQVAVPLSLFHHSPDTLAPILPPYFGLIPPLSPRIDAPITDLQMPTRIPLPVSGLQLPTVVYPAIWHLPSFSLIKSNPLWPGEGDGSCKQMLEFQQMRYNLGIKQ